MGGQLTKTGGKIEKNWKFNDQLGTKLYKFDTKAKV